MKTTVRRSRAYVPTWEWVFEHDDGNERLGDKWMSKTAYTDSYEAFCALRRECGKREVDFAARYGMELVNAVEVPRELRIVVDVHHVGRLYLVYTLVT